MPALSNSFGGLHFVLLHLPIGFLLLAGLLALFSFFQKSFEHKPALDISVALGAAAAILSAGTGWLLAKTGARDATILERHEWLGFAAAILAVFTWWMRHSRLYFVSLYATIGLVIFTGHFGGSLTHGEDYLFNSEKSIAQTQPGFPPVDVATANPSDMEQLRTNHISVSSLGDNSPWLSVSLTGKKDLDESKLSLLKKVGKQIASLDLSRTNLSDPLLTILKDLPNLTWLNLYGTNISAAGLKNAAGLKYLRYLNITETNVGDDALQTLLALPNLHALYIWRSQISPGISQRIRTDLPSLQLQDNLPVDTSAKPLQLRPPKILFAHNIFSDTVKVGLDFPFKKVDIFYTLDQASPTTQSYRYKGEPLVFEQSTTLRAIAAKEGWENSVPVEAVFVKRKWNPQKITLLNPPSPQHLGDGPFTLSDGVISDNHMDKNYLGYEGEHMNVVLDFGEPIDFNKISLHYAEATVSWVFAPVGLQVWTSTNGQQWSPCLDTHYPAPLGMTEKRAAILSEPIPKPVKTRYLKVRVENLLKNPKWHPGAGKKCWVFVDEILVE